MSHPSTSGQDAMPRATTIARQGDNIAHALAGAGGGILSMTLTSGIPSPASPELQC